MGYALAQKFSDFEPIFLETLREADACLGFSLSNILKDGPAEKLKLTEITQPALLTVSTAMGRWLKSKGKSAQYATGHSLGEYSALVYADALKFSDAVKLVHLRGQLMESAVPSGQGGMLALIGCTIDNAQKLCEAIHQETNQVLEVSVLNNPGQVVISGAMPAIDKAASRVKEFGIRMGTKLEVSGPFHCSLLSGAGKKLRNALDQVEIRTPSIPTFSNVTASEQKNPDEIRQNLELQVSKTVRWEDCIRSISSLGVQNFVEVGSGKVLTGILKKIAPDLKVTPLDGLENLDTLAA